MGLEAQCTARTGRQVSRGQARLEEKHLLFRGNFRLKIALGEIKSVEAQRGVLTVKFDGGVAMFDLGPAAETWALKIRYPRSRMDKLGVKPESYVVVRGVDDSAFEKELHARAKNVSVRLRKDSDLIFVHAPDVSRLKHLRSLRETLKPAGAIWVVWPKGQKHIKEDHVRAAAIAAGLVDVKVMSFSETLSALKLMIPRKLR